MVYLRKNVTVRIINTSFYFNYKKFSKFCITRYHKRDIVFSQKYEIAHKISFYIHTNR